MNQTNAPSKLEKVPTIPKKTAGTMESLEFLILFKKQIEATTEKKLTRGGDKLINEILDMAQGRDPSDDTPRVMICAGMKEAVVDG